MYFSKQGPFKKPDSKIIVKHDDLQVISETYRYSKKITYYKLAETDEVLAKVGRMQVLMTCDESYKLIKQSKYKLVEKICIGKKRKRTRIKSRFGIYDRNLELILKYF